MTYHLGADYFEDPDGTFVSQPKKYIDKLADTYRQLFNDDPPKGYKTPLDKNDHPELDTSEIQEGGMAAKYLTMVGQLQWLVTLGRFDIHAQVATMSRFRAAPRQGHMDRLKRIYSYAIRTKVTEFRQPLQVQSHLEMPRILVQLGHTQRTWKLAPQTDPKWSPTWSLTRFQPKCPLSARDGRYACQVSRANCTHSRL